MLDHTAGDLEPVGFAIGVVVGVTFFNAAAALADEEFSQIALMTMITGDESIERFDPVNKSQFREEVECAVDGWRLGTAAFRLKSVEQVISFHRAAVRNHEFKHMLAQRRESFARRFANLARGVKPFSWCAMSHSSQIGDAEPNGKV